LSRPRILGLSPCSAPLRLCAKSSRLVSVQSFAWRTAWFARQPATLNSPSDNSPAPDAAPAAVSREVYRLGWRRLVLWPLALLVKLWARTLRFELSPDSRRHLTKRDEPVAFVVWHNRLFLTFEIFRRYRGGRPIYALISASQDGAWLDAFYGLVGMRAVRGSSSRLGREAVSALVEVLREGHDIGITPDGPRGPCYDLKPGGVIVARRARVPLLLVGGGFASAWRLGSWDRFYLPKPFSRVRLECELVTPAEFAQDRDAVIAHLKARMLAINPDK
jgi:lysophospholipid acyltransferase (LPLAT)-like uncharacterized protein